MLSHHAPMATMPIVASSLSSLSTTMITATTTAMRMMKMARAGDSQPFACVLRSRNGLRAFLL